LIRDTWITWGGAGGQKKEEIRPPDKPLLDIVTKAIKMTGVAFEKVREQERKNIGAWFEWWQMEGTGSELTDAIKALQNGLLPQPPKQGE